MHLFFYAQEKCLYYLTPTLPEDYIYIFYCSANEESLLPLHTKLKQLQIDVQEKRDKINDLKVIINKNNVRIEKLLNTGNLQ